MTQVVDLDPWEPVYLPTWMVDCYGIHVGEYTVPPMDPSWVLHSEFLGHFVSKGFCLNFYPHPTVKSPPSMSENFSVSRYKHHVDHESLYKGPLHRC